MLSNVHMEHDNNEELTYSSLTMYMYVHVFLHACMRAYDLWYSDAPCNLANTQANRRLGSVKYLFHLG